MGFFDKELGLPPSTLQHRQFDTAPDDFQLSPEQEAKYEGMDEGARHRERMKEMKTQAERNRYIAGIREGVQERDKPKRGDFDNPLKRDMPKPPRQPRQKNPMTEVRRVKSLARKARGRRR